MTTATRNFHLPMPQAFHAELMDAAAELGQPATKLAMELVRKGLEELRRAKRRRDISAYAHAAAGTRDDYDAMLEAASLEHIAGVSEKPTRYGAPRKKAARAPR
jgi:hypothetical protein